MSPMGTVDPGICSRKEHLLIDRPVSFEGRVACPPRSRRSRSREIDTGVLLGFRPRVGIRLLNWWCG
jgi:hypothetical protein